MKNLLAVVCLLAAVSSVLALDCYTCSYYKGENDAAVSVLKKIDDDFTKYPNCESPDSTTDSETCTASNDTTFCYYTKSTITLRDSDNNDFEYTVYNRGCEDVDDDDIDSGDCVATGDYAMKMMTFTNYTVTNGSYSGYCFCDSDACNTGGSGGSGASAVALSTLTVLAAAILKFVH